MKALARLPTSPSYVDHYAQIRDGKHNPTRQALVNRHEEIEERFDELEHHAAMGMLEAIGVSPLHSLSIPLRACYSGKTKRLLALKNHIHLAQAKGQLNYCPYCGTTTNDTLYHYLTGVRFPEFFVHALNLIPCCFRCNTIKDDAWLDAAGQHQFLHLVLDKIPDVDFFYARLFTSPAMLGAGALFRVERSGIPARDWRLLKSHFEPLHMIERYDENANDEIGQMLDAAASYVLAGGPDPRAFIRYESGNAEKKFGRNHWRAVPLRELAEHAELENWVTAATLML